MLRQQFCAQMNTQGNLNNEVGLPLTLLRMDDANRGQRLLEMGMNGVSASCPRMTAAGAAGCRGHHQYRRLAQIEFLGSREGICRAKLEILEGLREGCTAVLPGDEPLLWEKRDALGCRTVTYGIENPACDLTAYLHGDSAFDIVNNGLPAVELPQGGRFSAKRQIRRA